MPSAPLKPHRLLRHGIWHIALVLLVGHSTADKHLHLDEQEEEVCTFCAISDEVHDWDPVYVGARLSEWRSFNDAPVLLAISHRRQYEIGYPRAPPISVS